MAKYRNGQKVKADGDVFTVMSVFEFPRDYTNPSAQRNRYWSDDIMADLKAEGFRGSYYAAKSRRDGHEQYLVDGAITGVANALCSTNPVVANAIAANADNGERFGKPFKFQGQNFNLHNARIWLFDLKKDAAIMAKSYSNMKREFTDPLSVATKLMGMNPDDKEKKELEQIIEYCKFGLDKLSHI